MRTARACTVFMTLAVFGGKALAAEALPKQPNIVFILTDDQGYGDLSCHGNPILKTPNIDALYAKSVRFTDFHVSPTCAPTRTALMTARHEFHSGVTHTINEREPRVVGAPQVPFAPIKILANSPLTSVRHLL